MTRAEAIEQLEKAYKECIDNGQTCGKDSVFWKRAEGIKMGLNSLKIDEMYDLAMENPPQECDDLISREAVLDIINNPLNIRLDEIIKKLPSVTPTERIVNAIPIPENATNGDVITAIFSSRWHNNEIIFSDDWWYSPYKRGDNNG